MMKKTRKTAILLAVLFFGLLCFTPQLSAAKKPSLSKKSVTLLKGTSIKLKAKNFPGSVTWSSSRKKVAVVKNGTVTAKKTGSTVITARSGKTKLTCKVKVVKDPKISASSLRLAPGETHPLKLTGLAKGLKVSWKSSNKKVVTVKKSGKITAKAEGTAKITATVLKKKFTCSVTVSKNAGEDSKEKADSGKDSKEKENTGSDSKEKKDSGDDSKSASDPDKKPVVKGKKVTSVKLNKSSLTLIAGESATLKAAVAPSDAAMPQLSWKSSDSSIASVNAKGKVSAKKKGTVTITAAAQDGSGKKDSCKVTVEPVLITSVSLNKKSATLNRYGKGLTLKASVSPSNATEKELKWSSSDSKVATVDNEGTVKAVGTGTAEITAAATDGSGKKAVCSVEVVFQSGAVTGVITSIQPGTSTSGLTVSLRITNQSCEDIFADWIMEADALSTPEDLILVADGYEAAWEKEYGNASEDSSFTDEEDDAAEDEDDALTEDEDEEFFEDTNPKHETPFIKIGKGDTKEIVYREYNPEIGYQSASATSDSYVEIGIENESGYSYLYMADLDASSKLVCIDDEDYE